VEAEPSLPRTLPASVWATDGGPLAHEDVTPIGGSGSTSTHTSCARRDIWADELAMRHVLRLSGYGREKRRLETSKAKKIFPLEEKKYRDKQSE
jgi:hypothetical protein